MKNLGQMMKQAQAMQAKMAEVKEKLGQLEVTGQSGAGMVKATVNGKSALRGLKIDTSLVDPSEVEDMEDIIVAAVNAVQTKVEDAVPEGMQRGRGRARRRGRGW